MPTFRAEFEIAADLVLPGKETISIDGRDCKITFLNQEKDHRGFVAGLIAQVVGPCQSLRTAPDELGSRLSKHLDMFTVTSHTRFRIGQVRRVVEWEPGKKTREFQLFEQFEMLYPPEPGLDRHFSDSVERLAKCEVPAFVSEAMRLFRLGFLDDQQPDQFQRFWLALEVIAENRKPPNKSPIPCPQCRNGLFCSTCNTTPLRRPMARQAIAALIEQLVGDDGKELYRRFVNVRDWLVHGRPIASIEADVGAKFSAIVDAIGTLAWKAIMSSLPTSLFDQPLHIGHRGGHFAAKMLRVGGFGTFNTKEGVEQPADSDIPSGSVTLRRKNKS